MNKPNLSQIVKSVRATLTQHSPEILTGIGIASMVTTTILAVRATPTALKILEDAASEKEDWVDVKPDITDLPKIFPVKETFVLTWKCYIPAAVTFVTGVGCIIGASSVNVRRNAALATAYTLSETALKEYKEKVIETIGEKKEQVVRDSIAKDHIEKNPIGRNEIIVTGKGSTRCYDCISGRYFESEIDNIRKAENELTRQILVDNYASLNDFYDLIGLSPISLGDDLGWNIDKKPEIYFSAQLSDDEEPCLVVNYSVAPRYDYYKSM